MKIEVEAKIILTIPYGTSKEEETEIILADE